MTYSTEQDLTIRVPITEAMRAKAREWANEQPTPEKAAQVYQNTLAVLAVQAYLQWQGYDTLLEESDSGCATSRLSGDVADLAIAGLGRIECRPVPVGATVYPLPPDVWHNRIGYVMVHLEEREAVLSGFVFPFDPEDPLEGVDLSDLASLDELMDYLDRLEKGKLELDNDSSSEGEQVRQMWPDPYDRLMVLAQLERIYRSEPRSKWRVKGEKVISGRVLEGAGVREEAIPDDRIELQGVVERLLQRLEILWSEGNGG